jgi:hypothetical protein
VSLVLPFQLLSGAARQPLPVTLLRDRCRSLQKTALAVALSQIPINHSYGAMQPSIGRQNAAPVKQDEHEGRNTKVLEPRRGSP